MAFIQSRPLDRAPPEEFLGTAGTGNGAPTMPAGATAGSGGTTDTTGSALQVFFDWTAHQRSSLDDSLVRNPVLAVLVVQGVGLLLFFVVRAFWRGKLC